MMGRLSISSCTFRALDICNRVIIWATMFSLLGTESDIMLHTCHDQMTDKLHKGWTLGGMFIDDFHHCCVVSGKEDPPVGQMCTPCVYR